MPGGAYIGKRAVAVEEIDELRAEIDEVRLMFLAVAWPEHPTIPPHLKAPDEAKGQAGPTA